MIRIDVAVAICLVQARKVVIEHHSVRERGQVVRSALLLLKVRAGLPEPEPVVVVDPVGGLARHYLPRRAIHVFERAVDAGNGLNGNCAFHCG